MQSSIWRDFSTFWSKIVSYRNLGIFMTSEHFIWISKFHSKKACSLNLSRVFICICPRHCEKNSCHNVKTFLLSSIFQPKLWLTFEWQKQKFAVRLRLNFFSNFGHLFGPFNPVFYFHFKNLNFFEIGLKLTFLWCFFHGTIFFAEEFLLS